MLAITMINQIFCIKLFELHKLRPKNKFGFKFVEFKTKISV